MTWVNIISVYQYYLPSTQCTRAIPVALTGLWFLPKPAQRPNTNEWINLSMSNIAETLNPARSNYTPFLYYVMIVQDLYNFLLKFSSNIFFSRLSSIYGDNETYNFACCFVWVWILILILREERRLRVNIRLKNTFKYPCIVIPPLSYMFRRAKGAILRERMGIVCVVGCNIPLHRRWES
jgi:hypothetical protein